MKIAAMDTVTKYSAASSTFAKSSHLIVQCVLQVAQQTRMEKNLSPDPDSLTWWLGVTIIQTTAGAYQTESRHQHSATAHTPEL